MRRMRRIRTARLPMVVTVGCQTLIVVMTMMRRLGIISWSRQAEYVLVYKTLSWRAKYLSALKSKKKTLS